MKRVYWRLRCRLLGHVWTAAWKPSQDQHVGFCPNCGRVRSLCRAETANRCAVGPAVRSQWRNHPHWHVVWPHHGGTSWCYETAQEALERLAELDELAAL